MNSEQPTSALIPPDKRRPVAWFSATVAFVSAIASAGSMFIAWRSVEAYPHQLVVTERLRACVGVQEEVSKVITAAADIETATDDSYLEMYRIATAEFRDADTKLDSIESTLVLIGPRALADAALEVTERERALFDVVNGRKPNAQVTAASRNLGFALRAFNEECRRALR